MCCRHDGHHCGQTGCMQTGRLRSTPAFLTAMITTIYSNEDREWQHLRPDGSLYSVNGDIDATIYRYRLASETCKRAVQRHLNKTKVYQVYLFIEPYINWLQVQTG
uniref:Uncharacterized protein n=1 Tax=Schizaphis graminum TaxID=13262 RepID=A0A2S2P2M1_SCHGA